MNVIKELQIWYASHCNGEWEHSFGVGIDTLDNPGWWVKINLTGTELERRKFQPIRHGISDDEKSTESEWMTCQVKDNIFNAAGIQVSWRKYSAFSSIGQNKQRTSQFTYHEGSAEFFQYKFCVKLSFAKAFSPFM